MSYPPAPPSPPWGGSDAGQPTGYAPPTGYASPSAAAGPSGFAGEDQPTQQFAPLNQASVAPQPTYRAQTYPGQTHPGQTHPAQTYPGQTYPAQPYPAQTPPAQMYPAPVTYVVPPPMPPQRPAVVAMSASMTVTASALWVCALATAWLFAAAGERRLAADQDFDGQVLILLNRFSARLLDGLAVPLFGLPAVAFVAAFLLLSGRRWAQVLYSLLGAVTVGWLVWWLGGSWGWAVAPIAYVVISVLILWTPAARRWFGRRARPGG